jgi:hypothetical protein
MLRQHRILPDAPSGYALLTNRGRSLWSVLEPVGSTNLFLNPSVETALTGYQALTGSETITRDNTRSRRGAWSIKIVTSSSSNRGMVANNGSSFLLTAGITYTLSFDFCGAGAVPYSAYVSGPSSSEPGRIRMIGRGVWQRLTLTFTPTVTGSHNINLLKETSTSTAPFWCDGWQLEALPYATTYVDGDQRGYDVDYYDLTTNTDKPSPYQWLGTPHASQSRRLATTRSGGRRRYLDEFGWSQPSMTGTLLTPMLISDARFANGGGMFQRAIRDVRTLALVGMIIGNPLAQAAQLADLLNPENGPATLVYQKHEDDDEVYVPAVYQSGLEGDITNEYRLDTPMQFSVYDTMVNAFDVSAALNYTQDVPNASAIVMRDSAGLWQSLGTGITGSTVGDPRVRVIKPNNLDGSVIIGGDFKFANGVAANSIVRYSNGTFTALGSGATTGEIWDIAVSPDGLIYAGGDASFAGVINLARWNGTSWTSLGTVAGGSVETIAIGPDGMVYVGGAFTSINAVANTNKIARYNPATSTWSALSSSTPNNIVRTIEVNSQGTVFAGGEFTAIGGTTTNYIASWTPSTGTWSALSNQLDNGVQDMMFGPSGNLYIVGAFTVPGSRIVMWNGSAFNTLGTGLSFTAYSAIARDVFVSQDESVYVSGEIDQAGGISLPDSMALWRNGWRPLDIDLAVGSFPTSAIYVTPTDQRVFVGFAGGGTAKSAVTTVTNTGTDVAYPTVTFTGPGQIHQLRNYTTNDVIYFSNLVLNSGETATLRIQPGGTTFESNFRGSLLGYIGPGSNPSNWKLQQGNNNVSSFMTSTTAATSITLTFRPPVGKLK